MGADKVADPLDLFQIVVRNWKPMKPEGYTVTLEIHRKPKSDEKTQVHKPGGDGHD
jgi:hypothetical protein